MKKLLYLLLILPLFMSCSSSDDDTPKGEAGLTPKQISGTYNMLNASVLTKCDFDAYVIVLRPNGTGFKEDKCEQIKDSLNWIYNNGNLTLSIPQKETINATIKSPDQTTDPNSFDVYFSLIENNQKNDYTYTKRSLDY